MLSRAAVSALVVTLAIATCRAASCGVVISIILSSSITTVSEEELL